MLVSMLLGRLMTLQLGIADVVGIVTLFVMFVASNFVAFFLMFGRTKEERDRTLKIVLDKLTLAGAETAMKCAGPVLEMFKLVQKIVSTVKGNNAMSGGVATVTSRSDGDLETITIPFSLKDQDCVVYLPFDKSKTLARTHVYAVRNGERERLLIHPCVVSDLTAAMIGADSITGLDGAFEEF